MHVVIIFHQIFHTIKLRSKSLSRVIETKRDELRCYAVVQTDVFKVTAYVSYKFSVSIKDLNSIIVFTSGSDKETPAIMLYDRTYSA